MSRVADREPEHQVMVVVDRYMAIAARMGKSFSATFRIRLYFKLVDLWAIARDGGSAPDIFWMDGLDDLGLAQAMHHFYAE